MRINETPRHRTSHSACPQMGFVRAFAAMLLALLTPLAAAQPLQPVPVRFDPATIDFGFVTPGEVHQATATVTNTSDRPIDGIRLSSSCSCTTFEFDKTTLQPGETAELSVTLTGSYAMIDRTTQIRVSADQSRFGAPAELGVRSYPNLGLIAKPHMIAGSRDGTEPITGELTVSSVDGRPFTVKAVNFEPFNTSQSPASEQTVGYRMHGPNKRHWMVIETTHPTCPFMVLPVGDGALRQESLRNARAESIQLADRREITIGYIEPGQSVEVTVPIFRTGAGLDRVVRVTNRQPGLHLELVGWENQKFSHGSRQAPIYQVDAMLRITATGQPGEAFMGAFNFQAEGDRSALTIHVIGRIVEPGKGTVQPADAPPPGLLRPSGG